MRCSKTHLPVSHVLGKPIYSRSYPYGLGAGLWRASGDFSYDTVRHENQERDPCLLRVRPRMSHSEPVLSPVPSPQRLSTSRSTSPTRGSLSAASCTWRCWPRRTSRSLSSSDTKRRALGGDRVYGSFDLSVGPLRGSDRHLIYSQSPRGRPDLATPNRRSQVALIGAVN